MRSSMKLRVLYYIGCLLLGVCVACRPQSRQDGSSAMNGSDSIPFRDAQALNPRRAELGLRVIEPSWFLYRSRPRQDEWKIRKGGHGAKTVFKDESGRVVSEEDYYHSGNTYTDRSLEGALLSEEIIVEYAHNSSFLRVSYLGTNAVTAKILSKYVTNGSGASRDLAGIMAAVRQATAGWPDAPTAVKEATSP